MGAAQDVADSLALWWREAGLHSITNATPFNWREAARPAAAPVPSAHAPVAASPQPQTAPQSPPPLRLVQPVAQPAGGHPAAAQPMGARAMPGDLPGFLAWLAEDGTQPEANWPGPVCLPAAAMNACLLVLTDMPGESIEDPALPFDAAQARFVGAMLAAIGLRIEDTAFAPLAIRRAPGGLLDEETAATLAARMRHYLALARPQAVLILGDRTSRALNAAQSGNAAGNLAEIHLSGGTLQAAALASPEHLMRRPTAKAKSWQTLRLLQGVMTA